MNNILFVSGYTINTPYETQIKKVLIPSLEKFNLKYWVKPFNSLGNWLLNAIQEPAIILEALNTFPEDIVWIDADGEVLRYPSLLYEIPPEFHIGVHWLSWMKHFNSGIRRIELVDGTFFARNNEETKQLIKIWKEASTDKGLQEQIALEDVLKKNPGFKVYPLPWAYCYISTTPHGKTHDPIDNAVVEHYQLSRKTRQNEH